MPAMATEDFYSCLMSKVYQCIFFLLSEVFHVIMWLQVCLSLTTTSVVLWVSQGPCFIFSVVFFLSLLADPDFNKVVYLLHVRSSILDL